MTSTEIHAVIFDCDGTLVDSETLSLAVLVEFVAELGLQISHAEAMDRFAGNELSVVFREIETRLGRSLPLGFLEEFRERQLSVLRRELKPCDGANELLSSMQLPFCVASNAPLNKIDVCLKTTLLNRHFNEERIFSAYQIEKWKPAPDLFLMAAESMNVLPQNCAVVEDSHFGIKAGLAAGMQVFAYRPPRSDELSLDSVRTISCLRELMVVF